MDARDAQVFEKWACDVAEKTDLNLNRNLLVRDEETRQISVNFDDQLVAMLREVRFLFIDGWDGHTIK